MTMRAANVTDRAACAWTVAVAGAKAETSYIIAN